MKLKHIQASSALSFLSGARECTPLEAQLLDCGKLVRLYQNQRFPDRFHTSAPDLVCHTTLARVPRQCIDTYQVFELTSLACPTRLHGVLGTLVREAIYSYYRADGLDLIVRFDSEQKKVEFICCWILRKSHVSYIAQRHPLAALQGHLVSRRNISSACSDAELLDALTWQEVVIEEIKRLPIENKTATCHVSLKPRKIS